MSTRNTRVLISSIFFMADSVVTGHWIMRYLSILSRHSVDLRGYFGSRGFWRVFGRKKWTDVRTLRTLRVTAPLTALETFEAFFPPSFLGASAAVFPAFAFGAIVNASDCSTRCRTEPVNGTVNQ